ncbi:MAG: glutaredoxin domain-containing protein [Pseudohongiellaceae bacterium]
MPEITVYSRRICSFCNAAKQLLQNRGYEYHEVNLDEHPELMADIMRRSGQRTVPQIFVGEKSVGGFTELRASILSGEFEQLTGSS